MQKLPAYQKSIIFITLLLALAFATPALADYLGPDRTVTTYVSYCRYVQKRCAAAKEWSMGMEYCGRLGLLAWRSGLLRRWGRL